MRSAMSTNRLPSAMRDHATHLRVLVDNALEPLDPKAEVMNFIVDVRDVFRFEGGIDGGNFSVLDASRLAVPDDESPPVTETGQIRSTGDRFLHRLAAGARSGEFLKQRGRSAPIIFGHAQRNWEAFGSSG